MKPSPPSAFPYDPDPYDAVLLVSFGGPDNPADVLPFLENVTKGKGIPPERLTEVGEHYSLFGGKSPINEHCRELLAELRKDFAANDLDLPVYWGNRNWDPYLKDSIADMEAAGVKRALCLVTSAYASYSGCRQYRENLFAARDDTEIELNRIRHYSNHPGFIGPFAEATAEALDGAPAGTHVVFVTHSIPTTMNEASGGPGQSMYVRQHLDVAAEVADRAGVGSWSLAYCSRSGPPQMPWLEPDINDHLRELHVGGTTAVVVVPIGFISDHMEVIFDLDTEAAETARQLGMDFTRVATPGTHPDFVAMMRELVLERAAAERGEGVERRAVGALGPHPDVCPVDCCTNPRATLQTIS